MSTPSSRPARSRTTDQGWHWPVLPRTWRRVAVGATYLGGLGVLVVLWAVAADAVSPGARWLAFIPGVAGLLGLAGICMTATRATWWRVPLDERDTYIRDHAYRRSYWLAIVVVGLGLVYAMLAADREDWWLPETPDDFGTILMSVLFLVGSFPSAVVAWIEPDIERENDDDINL